MRVGSGRQIDGNNRESDQISGKTTKNRDLREERGGNERGNPPTERGLRFSGATASARQRVGHEVDGS